MMKILTGGEGFLAYKYMKTQLCFSVVDVNWTCLQECIDQSVREGGGNEEWEEEKTHC